MNNLEAILAPEVLATIITVAALAMAVRSLLSYSKENSEITPKLDKIERDLNRLRGSMKDHKEKVDEQLLLVQPLVESDDKFRSYYEQIRKIQMDSERKGRIQRKRMGFDK